MCAHSWYQQLELLISGIRISDINNSNSWYQECAIAAIPIVYITNRRIFDFVHYKNSHVLHTSLTLVFMWFFSSCDFILLLLLVTRNLVLDFIHICDHIFVILFSWRQVSHIVDINNVHAFLISGNRFADINNCYYWYQVIELLISVMQRRSNCNSWYQQCQLLISRINSNK